MTLFAPTSSAMAPLALPLVTADRLDPLPTSTVALESATVGVSFTCVRCVRHRRRVGRRARGERLVQRQRRERP